MNMTTVYEDIQSLLQQWPNNQAATSAQLDHWPRNCPLLERLPKDHPDCLRLLVEDGGNNKPVFDYVQRTIDAFHWDKAQHRCPNDESLVRLGCFLHLTPEQIVLLVLKAQSEQGFTNDIYPNPNNAPPLIQSHQSLLVLLQGEVVNGYSYKDYALNGGDHWGSYCERKKGGLGLGFRPGLGHRVGAQELFMLLEESGQSDGYDFELFESMLEEALGGIFLCSHNSADVIRFVDRWRAEMEKRDTASLALRERHSIARLHLRVLERDYEEVLWENDRLSFEIGGTRARYYAKLGELEVRHVELMIEKDRLERQINLKEADPSLSREEIELRAEAGLKDSLLELDRQREFLDEGLNYELFGPQGNGHHTIGTAIDSEQASDYEKECRRLIREIEDIAYPLRKHTHVDGRVGSQFTSEQEKRLAGYFQAVQRHIDQLKEIKRLELCLGNHSIEHLTDIKGRVEEIMSEVKAICDQEGLTMALNRLPPADVSLPELCAWLEARSEEKRQDIKSLKDVMLARRRDPIYREQVAVLGSEWSIAAAQEILKAAIDAVEALLPPLLARLTELFAEEG